MAVKWEITTNPDSRKRMKITPTEANGARNTLDDKRLAKLLKLFVDPQSFLALLISSSSASKEIYVFPLERSNDALKMHQNNLSNVYLQMGGC